MKKETREVAEKLQKGGLDIRILEFGEPAARASDAARLIGCDVGQIAKSIVFSADGGDAVLVIANGGDRINEAIVSALIGKNVHKADPDFVRTASGFEIGGVPPLRTDRIKSIIFDKKLLDYDRIWAACGEANVVFSIDPKKLADYDSATIADVAA